eukprot:5626933-Pyramimonas_sp.AAC.1
MTNSLWKINRPRTPCGTELTPAHLTGIVIYIERMINSERMIICVWIINGAGIISSARTLCSVWSINSAPMKNNDRTSNSDWTINSMVEFNS